MIDTLVKYFGRERVQDALEKSALGYPKKAKAPFKRNAADENKAPSLNIVDDIEAIRETDLEKYNLIKDFYERLKARRILPEAQDIRHFAHLIGVKRIDGKSRREMISPLLRVLMEMPAERLDTEMRRAEDISERQRQQGFSVLTDKLLGHE
jgi:hypothetical protein